MSFEIVKPHKFKPQTFRPGRARLWKSGLVVVHPEDLQKAGIDGPAILMVDNAAPRVALRKPADGEDDIAIRPRKDKAAARAGGVLYSARAALRQAGWETGTDARYHGTKQVVNRDDGFLIIILDGDE